MLQIYIKLLESAITCIKSETAKTIISLIVSAVIGIVLFLIIIYSIIN